MQTSTAKHIGEMVGAGLGANYVGNVANGHPRHPAMKGGLTPRLAPTGDKVHDLGMQTGRLATNIFVAWLLVHVWFVYAGATAIGLATIMHFSFATITIPDMIIWLLVQIPYFWFWGRVFDGKRVKGTRHIQQVVEAPKEIHMQTTFVNNWGEPIPVAWDPNMGCFFDVWGRSFSVYNRAR